MQRNPEGKRERKAKQKQVYGSHSGLAFSRGQLELVLRHVCQLHFRLRRCLRGCPVGLRDAILHRTRVQFSQSEAPDHRKMHTVLEAAQESSDRVCGRTHSDDWELGAGSPRELRRVQRDHQVRHSLPGRTAARARSYHGHHPRPAAQHDPAETLRPRRRPTAQLVAGAAALRPQRPPTAQLAASAAAQPCQVPREIKTPSRAPQRPLGMVGTDPLRSRYPPVPVDLSG